MKKATACLIFTLFSVLWLSGCSTLNHTVGTGGTDGNEVASERQWYILWGLVPLNNVDGGQIAKSKGLTNYTIQSQASFLDEILNMITGIVTVSGQTVKVFAPSGTQTASQPAAAPSNALAMGGQSLANKDYKSALQYYQAAANDDPNSVAAYQGMGTCYYYLGQKDQALAAYEKALSLNPNNALLSQFIKALKGTN